VSCNLDFLSSRLIARDLFTFEDEELTMASDTASQTLDVLAEFIGARSVQVASCGPEFDLTPGKCSVSLERMVSKSTLQNFWDTVFSVYQRDVKTDADKAVVRSAILKDFALNSTSESRQYKGSIAMHLGEEVIAIERDMISKILHRTGLTARIFCQNYADVIRQLIKADSVLGAACLDNYRRTATVHVDANHSDLCFDCAGFCTGLSSREARFVKMVSTVKLAQADDVKEGKTVFEKDVQPKNQLTE